MLHISNYIVEKLHLNKDIKRYKDNDPFSSVEVDNGEDLLNWIVEQFDASGCGSPLVWDDTETYNAADDFENFDTTYGASIDWVDEFSSEIDNNMVAIFSMSKNKEANIENHPITKMFKDEFDVEVKYKKGGYTVKYWGDYEYAKNIIVSMMTAPTGESMPNVIAFIIKRYS